MSDDLADVSSAEEAARYLRIKEAALVRLARSKKIGSLKSGRVLTFPKEDLEAYVQKHRTPAEANPWGLTDSSLRRIREGRVTK